ncbi:hypothetical protein PPTG_20887 [Phytophthora nicotianae INRA-310]|uniref:Uncharacterized protein n=1 Tax=Phytophthora nicotianae (strain INRA-310) TaxID=761204 RepID=W2R9Q7_PHYN3|nr:hypothetical protein PPTG_20887 [Phytophthora nicotianae INRA-310]ETN22122.1 hypothetical protein PPTG_20887 [Phytophthora nicotianae INRA-310]
MRQLRRTLFTSRSFELTFIITLLYVNIRFQRYPRPKCYVKDFFNNAIESVPDKAKLVNYCSGNNFHHDAINKLYELHCYSSDYRVRVSVSLYVASRFVDEYGGQVILDEMTRLNTSQYRPLL